jgi:hypothetical protein
MFFNVLPESGSGDPHSFIKLDPDPHWLNKSWIRIRIKSMQIRNTAPNLNKIRGYTGTVRTPILHLWTRYGTGDCFETEVNKSLRTLV